MKKNIVLFCSVFMIIAVLGQEASAQMRLQKAVISDAGGKASNSSMKLDYTVGQTATGKASNGTTTGQFGFWNAKTLAASVRNDNGAGTIHSVTISPNPSAADINVEVNLTSAGNLDLLLHDASGRFIATIYSGKGNSGVSTIRFDGKDLASGAYFVTARVPGAILQSKLNIIR